MKYLETLAILQLLLICELPYAFIFPSFASEGGKNGGPSKSSEKTFFLIAALENDDSTLDKSCASELTPELIASAPWETLLERSKNGEVEVATLDFCGSRDQFLARFFLLEDSMQYALHDMGEQIVHAPNWAKLGAGGGSSGGGGGLEIPQQALQKASIPTSARLEGGTWVRLISYFHSRNGPEFIFGKEPGWHCTQMHIYRAPHASGAAPGGTSESRSSGTVSPQQGDNLFVFTDLSPIPLCAGTNYVLRFNMKETQPVTVSQRSGGDGDCEGSKGMMGSSALRLRVTVNLSITAGKSMYSSFIRKGVQKDVGALVQKWRSRVESTLDATGAPVRTIQQQQQQQQQLSSSSSSTRQHDDFKPIDIRGPASPPFSFESMK